MPDRGGATRELAEEAGEKLVRQGVREFAQSLPPKLYHYTSAQTAELIEKSGHLGLPGRPLYLTTKGNLSPLQAQLELALPPHNTAVAVFEVDTSALIRSRIVRVGRVVGNVYRRPGGGTEIVYEGIIPRKAFRRIR